MILSDDELKKLTKKKWRRAQRQALIDMQIEHKVRADGSLVVSKAHVEHLLDGGERTTIAGAPFELNMEAIT